MNIYESDNELYKYLLLFGHLKEYGDLWLLINDIDRRIFKAFQERDQERRECLVLKSNAKVQEYHEEGEESADEKEEVGVE